MIIITLGLHNVTKIYHFQVPSLVQIHLYCAVPNAIIVVKRLPLAEL